MLLNARQLTWRSHTYRTPDDFILDTQIPFGEGTDGTNLAKTLGLDNGLAGQFQVPSIDVKDPVQRRGRADKLRDIRQLIQEKVTDVTSLRKRALYVLDKEIARARNFERFREIEEWWPIDYAKKSN